MSDNTAPENAGSNTATAEKPKKSRNVAKRTYKLCIVKTAPGGQTFHEIPLPKGLDADKLNTDTIKRALAKEVEAGSRDDTTNNTIAIITVNDTFSFKVETERKVSFG